MSLDAIYRFSKVLNHKYYFTENFERTALTNEEQFNAWLQFYDEFKTYTLSVLKNKKFTDRELADYIFEASFKSTNKYKESLRRHLFASFLLIDHYKKQITVENIKQYLDVLAVTKIDLERLIACIEVHYLGNSQNIELRSTRKYTKELRDILNVAKNLFFIDEAKDISHFHAFDIRPYSIFPIRQLIEMYGKEILGLLAVEDSDGNFSRRHLYCEWEFIKKETNAGDASRIKIPFDIEVLLKIQKWTNRFVHTTIDAPYYVIFNAITMTYPLFKSDLKGIRDGILCYDNTKHIKLFADITITNYNELRNSFNDYINEKSKTPNQYKAVWKEIKAVKSYILSL